MQLTKIFLTFFIGVFFSLTASARIVHTGGRSPKKVSSSKSHHSSAHKKHGATKSVAKKSPSHSTAAHRAAKAKAQTYFPAKSRSVASTGHATKYGKRNKVRGPAHHSKAKAKVKAKSKHKKSRRHTDEFGGL